MRVDIVNMGFASLPPIPSTFGAEPSPPGYGPRDPPLIRAVLVPELGEEPPLPVEGPQVEVEGDGDV